MSEYYGDLTDSQANLLVIRKNTSEILRIVRYSWLLFTLSLSVMVSLFALEGHMVVFNYLLGALLMIVSSRTVVSILCSTEKA